MKAYVLLTVFSLINLFDRVQPDAVALSIASMESLVEREKFLIDNVELYLEKLERKAEVIRSNLNRMRAENEKASMNVEAYLMNPLQAFSLLRRVHSDWLHWEIYLQKSIGDEYVDKLANERSGNPTEEEFHEAMDSMFRLQDTYELNPIEMSAGKLNGVQYDARLSAIDCFSIAYYLHGKQEYYAAGLWFHSAMNIFTDDDVSNEISELDMTKILYFYAQTMAKQDNLDRSVLLLTRLISLDPNNVNAIRQKAIWEMEIKARENIPSSPAKRVKEVNPATQKYQIGCRGAFKQRDPRLYCVYNTTTTPFLKLAPFKMEVVNLDPYMVLFHDVMTDEEIDILKLLAKPQLQRATVYNANKQAAVPVKTRTSKFSWFQDNTNEITLRINERLADITGFDLYLSEQIQVMNYGLGGHYDTHYDFFNVSRTSNVVQQSGDRIATALFYMSDVEQGGATVFPNIELAVYPKKGSLVLWYNLNSRGEGDANTLHAACPVLVGSKWICNKWIREKRQAFIRPCLPE